MAPFLARLGLDQGAASADIRRAYARELKLIDQERDAAGFQRLREAYETAMAWAKRRAEPPFGMPIAPVKAAPPVAETVFLQRTQPRADPRALSSEVFAGFMADFMTMMGSVVAPDLARCQSLLEHALSHQALQNLSARMLFEARVARQLAQGWRPGHEILLVAAARVFEWHCSARRLAEFGDDGARLLRALHERALFDAQPQAVVRAQRLAVARLRTGALPDAAQLLNHMRHVDALENRFPSWLALVTDVGQIARWRHQLVSERASTQVRKPAGKGWFGWGGWVILLLVLNLIRVAFQG